MEEFSSVSGYIFAGCQNEQVNMRVWDANTPLGGLDYMAFEGPFLHKFYDFMIHKEIWWCWGLPCCVVLLVAEGPFSGLCWNTVTRSGFQFAC